MKWFLQLSLLMTSLTLPLMTHGEEVAEIAKLNRDVMVPDQLVREIERWYLQEYRLRSKKTDEPEHEILATIRRHLLDVTVEFGKGKALHEATRVGLPTGGGIIDFADLLNGDRGGFTMKMSIDKPPKDGKMRLFYVSAAKRRTLVDGDYGTGCGKWVELTNWYHSPAGHEPIKLYATEQRHLSVSGGIWVFAQLFEDQLWLGALTLKDSRFPTLQCS